MKHQPSQENIKEFLSYLMNLSYNKKCADCNNLQPSWVSLSFSLFICYECSGLHRNLGVKKSKTKSTTIDSWTLDELRRMYIGGNKNKARLPEGDFNARYAETTEFLAYLDELYAKSQRDEPGDSFMIRKVNNKTTIKHSELKKIEKKRFGDEISSSEEVSEMCEVEESSEELMPEATTVQFKFSDSKNKLKNLSASRSPFCCDRNASDSDED